MNDIKAVNNNKNFLLKFVDDITVSLPIEENVGLDESETEVLSFIEWSEKNWIENMGTSFMRRDYQDAARKKRKGTLFKCLVVLALEH